MKKNIALLWILMCLAIYSGCALKPPDSRSIDKDSSIDSEIKIITIDRYFECLEKGDTFEKKKKLKNALYYYKQAFEISFKIASDRNEKTNKARRNIHRVRKKMNLAKKYCQDYQKFIENLKASEAQKALEKVHNIWPDYTCKKNLPTKAKTTLEDEPIESEKDKKAEKPLDYKILPEAPISYNLKKGDTISKLCQQYYGTTADYKLVHIVLDYNTIDPMSLVIGQTILFPTIQISERKYKPKTIIDKAERKNVDDYAESIQIKPSTDRLSMRARGLHGLKQKKETEIGGQIKYGTFNSGNGSTNQVRSGGIDNKKIQGIKINGSKVGGINASETKTGSNSIDDTKQPIEAAMELPKTHKLSTTITRHPTFDAPEEVNINKEFAVQITLTENLITPDVIIKTPPGEQKPAKVTSDGKLKMQLTSAPQQKEWRIDIVLAASGFKLPKGNTASVILPQTGDSTPAVFYLRAKPILTATHVTSIYATFWHKGTYLAKLVRKITVINPEFKKQKTTTDIVGQSFVSTETPLAKSRSADNHGTNHTKQTVKMNVGFKAPDLTLFILKNPIQGRADETQIIINSPHLQPIAQTYPTPKELDQWLEHQYRRFAHQGSRAKIIPLNPNIPSDSESKEMSSHIKGFGRELYRKYAPAAFKRAFWKLVDQLGADFDSIQILSNNPLLPWEMMRPMRDDGSDERDFMGLEFRIGRWHINPGAFQQERPSQAMAFRKLMVIAPRYQKEGALPQQDMELQALQKIRGYESIGGNLQGLLGLFQKLPQGIIHFAGHGLVKPSASGVRDYVICLEDAELDVMGWKGMIQAQNDAHPFFFFNACEVGQSRQMANFVDGWAPAVLESGASGYIGALWPLGDRGAADFAIRFYQALDRRLQNGSVDIAELLRVTRRRFLQNGDPTFLAYVFYGDPYLQMKWR